MALEYLVTDVGAFEAHTEHAFFSKPKLFLNVVEHGGGGRRGEGEDGRAGQFGAEGAHLQVGGAEVEPPLRNAVRLVDRDETHLHLVKFDQEYLRVDAFGREVEKLVLSQDDIVQFAENVVARHARVDGRGQDAPLTQVGHLVLHQGDEGRDDEARTLHHQGRHLKGDAFPTARGHQSHGVPSAQNALNDVALDAAEVRMAPVALQHGAWVVLRRSVERCVGERGVAGRHIVGRYGRGSTDE